MPQPTPIAFKNRAALFVWLAQHHDSETELWVRIYKKASGVESLDWTEMVEAALCWGWIDGLKRSYDDLSYVQRITPRKPKSSWSKKNVEHVARLSKEGLMQPSGLAQVEAAKADGRWEAAYAGQSDMVIDQDFIDALGEGTPARATFDKLTRSQLFIIYHRLHSAKKPETRERRKRVLLDLLAAGEKPR